MAETGKSGAEVVMAGRAASVAIYARVSTLMADIFDEVAKPQAQPKQAAPAASASSASDVFDQAAKEAYSPASQDEALRNLESNPDGKWYQQHVNVSPEAGPMSRFAGNIIGNPSLEDLGTGLRQVISHHVDSARMLLESSGGQQRDSSIVPSGNGIFPGLEPKPMPPPTRLSPPFRSSAPASGTSATSSLLATSPAARVV